MRMYFNSFAMNETRKIWRALLGQRVYYVEMPLGIMLTTTLAPVAVIDCNEYGDTLAVTKLFLNIAALNRALEPYALHAVRIREDAPYYITPRSLGKMSLWQRVKHSVLLPLGFSPLRPPMPVSLYLPVPPHPYM